MAVDTRDLTRFTPHQVAVVGRGVIDMTFDTTDYSLIRQRSYALGSPVLVGVTSAGTVDPVTGKPNFGFATRVDRHAAFIRDALASCGHAQGALPSGIDD